MPDDLDPNAEFSLTLSKMVRSIGESVAQASQQITQAQVEALKTYPKELQEIGMMPVFYHMQEVDVELKLVLELSTTSESKERWWIGAFLLGPKVTQTDTFDVSGASSMRMRFAPGPVDLGEDEEG